MKTLLIILTGIIILISATTAQNIVFTYDDAGNRIRREAGTKETEDENDQDEILATDEITDESEVITETNEISSTGTDFESESSLTNIDNEILADQSIKIYPNPTPGNFTLVLSGINFGNSYSFEVLSIIGGSVFKINDARSSIAMIDISDQPKGTYIIHVQAAGKMYSEKVIYQ